MEDVTHYEPKTYWHTNFSTERLKETERLFNLALQSCKVEISSFGPKEDSLTEFGRSLSLLTMPIINDKQETLPFELSRPDTVQVLIEHGHLLCFGLRHFCENCIETDTEWDKYLRSLTPDLPTYCSDFAFDKLRIDEFMIFWQMVCKSLNSEQVDELISWYLENLALGQPYGSLLRETLKNRFEKCHQL